MNWGKREERQKSDEKNGLWQKMGEKNGLGQAQPLHSRLQLFTLILVD
jgi:hypothetical protein